MGKFIPIKEGKLNCIVEGNGEPVLLIHGFPLDLRIWQLQVDHLVHSGFQVIRYDMRGFGSSQLPEKGRAYSHTEDLEMLLRHLGIQSVNIIASSFGGEVALDFAIDRGSYINKMVLMSPNISGLDGDPDSPLAKWTQMAKAGQIEQVKHEMLDNKIASSLNGQGKGMLERVIMDYSMWHFLNEDPRVVYHNHERLGVIIAPVLILAGSLESEWIKEASRHAHRYIPNSTFELLSDLNHFTYLESPEIVNEKIVAFLKG